MRALLLIAALLAVAAVAAPIHPVLNVASSPCAANISGAVADVITAGEDIAKALKECPGNTTQPECIADIAQCASDLARAGAQISMAITACGGKGSACVTDLFQCANDVSGAAHDIALAVASCKNASSIAQCVLDIIDTAALVDKLVISGEKAIKDCK